MSKLMDKYTFPGLKAFSLAASMGVLALGFGGNAAAGVIDASANAFDITFNVSIAAPLLPVVNIGAGPLNQSTAGANASDSDVLIAAGVPPFVSTASTITTAMTSFTPSGPGNANSSATINSLNLLLAAINTSLTAQTIVSTAALDKNAAQLVTPTGTTSIIGANLTVLGNVINLQAAPAPNTVVFNSGGIFVVLNGQVFNNTLNGPACTAPCVDTFSTTAIRITVTNALFLGSLINANIIVARSTASLTKDIQAVGVAEPATLVLFGLGLIGVFFLNRRREGLGALKA